MLRLVTSLNWTFGGVALVIALAYPFVYDILVVGGAKSTVERLVQTIVNAEQEHFALRESYLYFNSMDSSFNEAKNTLKLNIPNRDFVIEAFSDGTNLLVVSATTSGGALERGDYPPLRYEYRIKSKGSPGKAKWVALSSAKPGLF